MQNLERAFSRRLTHFKSKPEEALKLLEVGVSPVAKGMDQAELAAFATVARILLNLSEFITKG